MIGADTLMELKHWRNYEKVLTLCTFLVCPRMGQRFSLEMENERKRLMEMGGSFTYIRVQPVDTASTQIRQTLALGKEPELLSPVVMEYIRVCGLYGVESRLHLGRTWLGQLWEALFAQALRAFPWGLPFTARRLALLHGLDPDQAETAGLFA